MEALYEKAVNEVFKVDKKSENVTVVTIFEVVNVIRKKVKNSDKETISVLNEVVRKVEINIVMFNIVVEVIEIFIDDLVFDFETKQNGSVHDDVWVKNVDKVDVKTFKID